MGCGGHRHGTYQVEERVYAPGTSTVTATPCPECGYPTQEDFSLSPLWDGATDSLPGMPPGGQSRLGPLRLLRRRPGRSIT